MMNLIKIRNLTNNRTRLYQIPGDVAIKAATLVRVEFRDDSSALGLAVCDSWMEDDNGVMSIRNALNLPVDGDFKKVTAVYTETPLIVSDETEDASETDDPELAEDLDDENEVEG